VRGEFYVDSSEATASLLRNLLIGLRFRFMKHFTDRAIGQDDIALFAGETKLFAKIFLKGISR